MLLARKAFKIRSQNSVLSDECARGKLPSKIMATVYLDEIIQLSFVEPVLK